MAHVRQIRVYPVKGEPGTDLQRADIGAGGVAGDRPKKSPVHLVAESDRTTRANLVVSLTPDDLYATVGRLVRVGAAVLAVTTRPSGCPGVYAEVVEPGPLAVGDAVDVLPDPADPSDPSDPSDPADPADGPETAGTVPDGPR